MVPELSHFPTAWKKEKHAVSLFLASSLNVKGFFTYRSKASQFLRGKKNLSFSSVCRTNLCRSKRKREEGES